MLFVLYAASIVLFCIAAWLVPIALMPLVWLYKSVTKEAVILPTDPVFLMPFIFGTIGLLYLTRFIWAQWGFDTGWLFPLIIALIHFYFGGAQGANKGNQAQAYGTVYGVAVYGVLNLMT